MGTSNFDKVDATTASFTNLTAAGALISVDTVTATSSGDLPVTSVATGDVILGAYVDGGGAVSPGTITAGHVASDASSGDSVVVVWADMS